LVESATPFPTLTKAHLIEVTKVTPKPAPELIQITLDLRSAQALKFVTGAVGGKGPARDAITELWYALGEIPADWSVTATKPADGAFESRSLYIFGGAAE
jgi:hypothetical protein